jgi:hypothetical protein
MAIQRKSSRSRLILAIVMIAASLISAFLFSSLANQKTDMIVSTTFLLPGHQIQQSDLTTVQVSLGEVSKSYVNQAVQIIGTFTKIRIEAHELISKSSLAKQSDTSAISSVPLNVRAADVPDGVFPGSTIDIYWVQDQINQDIQLSPELVIPSAQVLDISKSGSNFGNEIALTVAINSDDVLSLLSATSQGRVVLVSAHG